MEGLYNCSLKLTLRLCRESEIKSQLLSFLATLTEIEMRVPHHMPLGTSSCTSMSLVSSSNYLELAKLLLCVYWCVLRRSTLVYMHDMFLR